MRIAAAGNSASLTRAARRGGINTWVLYSPQGRTNPLPLSARGRNCHGGKVPKRPHAKARGNLPSAIFSLSVTGASTSTSQPTKLHTRKLHTIRLRGPWEYQPLADGKLRCDRRFHQPTGLDAASRVWLAITNVD